MASRCKSLERLRLAEAPRHQEPLGAVDRLAGLQTLREVGDLALEQARLGVPGHGDVHRRDDVAARERLDHVGHGLGAARLLDLLGLGEGRDHDDGREALLADHGRSLEAVHARHLDVHEDDVRVQPARELDGLLAVARLADHVVALLLQHLAEVHADDGLVLGDDDAHGSAGLGCPSPVTAVTVRPR